MDLQTIKLNVENAAAAIKDGWKYVVTGQGISVINPKFQEDNGENPLLVIPFERQDRLDRAYSERTIAAVLLAKVALALGYKAGVGTDNNEDWADEWRVVLYVDLPHGQISWHIAPQDQHMLVGLPSYESAWDGTFFSRDPEFAIRASLKAER